MGVSFPETVAAPSAAVVLEKRTVETVGLAGRWEAGGPRGLPGDGPAPLWRRRRRRWRAVELVGPAGIPGDRFAAGWGLGGCSGAGRVGGRGGGRAGRAGGTMERARKLSGSGLALGLGTASASAWRRASQRWAWPLRSLRPGGDAR